MRGLPLSAKLVAVSWHDLLVIGAPVLLVTLLVAWLAVKFIGPAPKDTIVLLAGPKESSYYSIAGRYAKIIARSGVIVQVVETDGAQDNLRQLADGKIHADVGFVLGGVADGVETAGLMSLGGQRVQATVAEEGEWKKWEEANPGKSKVLATSRGLPAGFGVTVRTSATPALKKAVLQWVTTTPNILPGVRRFRPAANASPFDYVASLGIFTPNELDGVKRVTAAQALELASRGAQLIDVRTEREFNARHARGAVLVPYAEKSYKEPQFDGALDAFPGLAKLDKDRSIVFMCNGPECWKSYKASYAARASGFRDVYWLRGGVPEWVRSELPTEP